MNHDPEPPDIMVYPVLRKINKLRPDNSMSNILFSIKFDVYPALEQRTDVNVEWFTVCTLAYLTNIILLTLILGLLAKLIIPICRNYIAARKTGPPLFTSPIDPTSALWALTTILFLPYLTLLPGDIGQNARLDVFG